MFLRRVRPALNTAEVATKDLLILPGISRASFRRPLGLWTSLQLRNPMRIPAGTISSPASKRHRPGSLRSPLFGSPHSRQFLLQVHFLSLALSQKPLQILGAKSFFPISRGTEGRAGSLRGSLPFSAPHLPRSLPLSSVLLKCLSFSQSLYCGFDDPSSSSSSHSYLTSAFKFSKIGSCLLQMDNSGWCLRWAPMCVAARGQVLFCLAHWDGERGRGVGLTSLSITSYSLTSALQP